MANQTDDRSLCCAALELSKTVWVCAFSPPHGGRTSTYKLRAGDVDRLLSILNEGRRRAMQEAAATVEIVICYEVGYDGFWLARLLLARGKGETDGTIVAIGRCLARRKGRGGWLPPGLNAGAKPIAKPVKLVSGERFVMDAKAEVAINGQDIFTEITEGTELCAIGCIQYRDRNGRLLETGFLRIHDGQGNFLPSDNPEDEYED
jgi:hypothetical protein